MGGLCGWFHFGSGECSDRQVLEKMTSALTRFDRTSATTHLQDNIAVATTDGDLYHDKEIIAAISGKPEFRDTHFRERASKEGFSRTLASIYRERGADALAEVVGAFAFVLISHRQREVIMAVDRMGISSLTYARTDNYLVFGSRADAINFHPSITPAIEPQSIYNYIYFHMVPGPATAYSGQTRLLPGHYLRFRDGGLDIKAYWEMRFNEQYARPFAELREQFLSLLRDAVRQAAIGGRSGAFLSGGTDSSTLAGMLGEVSGAPAKTYSIGFAAEGYDEMEYARIAARHFGTQHHEYYVTPDDVADAIPLIAAVYDQPFGNSSAVPTYYCAKLAKADGVDTLLGGDGGDELFGGNARYADQKIFSLYDRVPAALRKALIEPLVFGIPGGHMVPVLRKARGYIEKALTPMPARLESYNILERFGPANIFTADFLHNIDTAQPLSLLSKTYHGAHAQSMINHMLALDFKFTLADNDLPKVSRTCELAQIAVAFPMLNDALVAFSAQLEPSLKLKGTKLRYFFKEALRGYLPDEIITKTKHGFGLPFGQWLRENQRLQDLVNSSLSDLKKRCIVRPEFTDQLVGIHLADHPGYYGTMAWVLMMLEQWLQHHAH